MHLRWHNDTVVQIKIVLLCDSDVIILDLCNKNNKNKWNKIKNLIKINVNFRLADYLHPELNL